MQFVFVPFRAASFEPKVEREGSSVFPPAVTPERLLETERDLDVEGAHAACVDVPLLPAAIEQIVS